MRIQRIINSPSPSSTLSLVVLIPLLLGVAAAAESVHDGVPTAQLLSQADSLLSSGKGADALELYGVAVERDSGSYVSRIKGIPGRRGRVDWLLFQSELAR
jgi:hypothetical protein